MESKSALGLDLLVLSYCHFVRMPLPQLLRDDVDVVLNMPHHRVERGVLLGELRRLVGKGCLEVQYGPRVVLPHKEMQELIASGWTQATEEPDRSLPPAEGVALLEQVEADRPELARYIRLCLTPAGGAVWERFATPKWHLYVDEEWPCILDGRVQLVFRTVTKRMAMLTRDLFLCRGGLRSAARIGVSPLGPWQALGWKSFRSGYEVSVDTDAEIGTALGDAYSSGVFAAESRLSDLAGHLCSLWSLQFNLKLHRAAAGSPFSKQ